MKDWFLNKFFEQEQPVNIPRRKPGKQIEVRQFGIGVQIRVKTVGNGDLPCPYAKFHRG